MLFAVYINDIAELFNFQHGVHVVVYADDIMLVTFSVSVLQKTLEVCQRELENLDMVINAKKTFCFRVGRRTSVICANIVTLNRIALQWSDELRYFGVYIVRSFRFKISLDKPKLSLIHISEPTRPY